MAEEEKKEEELPAWLAETLADAATKREENPALQPPTVDSSENFFLNISEEEKEKRFKRGNMIIVLVIILQLIALGFVIWWP